MFGFELVDSVVDCSGHVICVLRRHELFLSRSGVTVAYVSLKDQSQIILR